MGDRDTKGDVYEYMLWGTATAGQNGQLRTPRHIIATMVELVQPKPEDVICVILLVGPAASWFRLAKGSAQASRRVIPGRQAAATLDFNEGLFNGFDFDPTERLRIGSLETPSPHGVEGVEC